MCDIYKDGIYQLRKLKHTAFGVYLRTWFFNTAETPHSIMYMIGATVLGSANSSLAALTNTTELNGAGLSSIAVPNVLDIFVISIGYPLCAVPVVLLCALLLCFLQIGAPERTR